MIDIKGIKKSLKSNCIDCNYSLASKYGKCIDCPFVCSDRQQSGKYLNKFGIPYGMGKHHIYYFLYYPELNWNFPTIPNSDYNENLKHNYKHWHWTIHHENGNYYNDNKWNLVLLINTEHNQIHMTKNNPMNSKIVREKFAITTSMIQRNKILQGTHNFITNHPMNYPEIRNGRKSKKTKDLQNWIENLEFNKPVIINSELTTKFNYCGPYSLRCSIQRILNRLQLKDIQLTRTPVKGPVNAIWTIERIIK